MLPLFPELSRVEFGSAIWDLQGAHLDSLLLEEFWNFRPYQGEAIGSIPHRPDSSVQIYQCDQSIVRQPGTYVGNTVKYGRLDG